MPADSQQDTNMHNKILYITLYFAAGSTASPTKLIYLKLQHPQ